MAVILVSDLLKESATFGFAAKQPSIANEIGDNTQTNFEAYYNYPINDLMTLLQFHLSCR